MERNMTNEEKAQALVDELGIIYTECNRVTIKKLLMKMAKWKDEDAQSEKEALINKACEWLEHNVWEYTGFDSYELSEAFKKAMKGE